MEASTVDADVVVIGSGFGGSVAALRFSEAGQRVIVLERGAWIRREAFEADFRGFLWNPDRNAFGMHDFRLPGKQIFAWLGSGVGGGSNVFAAAMLRCRDFSGFPDGITPEQMAPYYERAESMMCVTHYPDYPPYSKVRGTRLLLRAERRLRARYPEMVDEHGPLPLAISFAPRGGQPGAEFINKHGARQRYSDPREQSILGGDIDAKNSMDRNYLALARNHGAEVRALHEVTRIEPLGDGYRLHYRVRSPDTGLWRRVRRRWFPSGAPPNWTEGTLTTRRVVVAAGSLGSTQLLLRNREALGLGPRLGERYSTNGDYITLIIAFRALALCWAAIAAGALAFAIRSPALAIAALVAYYAGIVISERADEPDIGTTCSDHIQFRGGPGEPAQVLIEGGRFPTLGKWGLAGILSALRLYRPERYRYISGVVMFLVRWVPPFGAIARTWPLPLLTMGRDTAYGKMRLDGDKLVIDFDLAANAGFYAHCDKVGALVAAAAKARWVPNLLLKLSGRVQVPHNLGGVPMGASADHGVVDSCGRVFGHRNLMVLDGSIIPTATGPNPALTILAVSERAMERVVAQLKERGEITAEVSGAAVAHGPDRSAPAASLAADR